MEGTEAERTMNERVSGPERQAYSLWRPNAHSLTQRTKQMQATLVYTWSSRLHAGTVGVSPAAQRMMASRRYVIPH